MNIPSINLKENKLIENVLLTIFIILIAIGSLSIEMYCKYMKTSNKLKEIEKGYYQKNENKFNK